MQKKRAILLLSGGLDSAVLLWTIKDDYEVTAITAKYGAENTREVKAAAEISKMAGIKRHIIIDLGFLKEVHETEGGKVPKGVPPTYIPSRNLILFGIAAHYAELIGASRILTGHISSDAFPDSKKEFIDAVNYAISVGSFLRNDESPIILAPFLSMQKEEIVRKAAELGVPLHLTWSCHLNGEAPCGLCEGCLGLGEAMRMSMGGR